MENLLINYNIVTPLLITFPLVPIIIGIFKKVTKTTIWFSLASLLKTLEFLICIILSFYFTKILFFENKITFFEDVKNYITTNIRTSINLDVLIYLLVTPVLFAVISLIFTLITLKLEYRIFDKLSSKLFLIFDFLWSPLKVLVSVMFHAPKAILNTLIVTLLLTLYSMSFPSPIISDQLDQSQVYKLINQYAIEPILNSSYVQKLPVLFNKTIVQLDQSQIPNEFLKEGSSLPSKLGNGSRIIWYFNGVTLDQAIKSNQAIDSFASDLVLAENDTRKKAKAIYKWIAFNVKYDYDKASQISNKKIGDTSSGAIQAFNTKTGICFDYSSLYVAMCRAVGLKVRLIVGMGFNGMVWGEHAWNQVYIPAEDTWINVDTTFAIGGNYFDRPNFDKDHKSAKIAGEW